MLRPGSVPRPRQVHVEVERNAARVEHQHTVGEQHGLVHVMRDDQHGGAVPAPKVEHQRVHAQPRQRVQRGKRLIEQQEPGRADQGPGQRGPLRLAA